MFVSSQPFSGKVEFDPIVQPTIPTWLYVVGGSLIAIIILLIFLLMRKNRIEKEEQELVTQQAPEEELPDLPDGETGLSASKRRQLEKMALERPEEFSKLIRTWLPDE